MSAINQVINSVLNLIFNFETQGFYYIFFYIYKCDTRGPNGYPQHFCRIRFGHDTFAPRDAQDHQEITKNTQRLKNCRSNTNPVYVSHDLTWKTHIEERLKKANKVLYLLRRNIALQVGQEIKLGLYKSLILPVLFYVSACTNPDRGELQQLERLQKKVVKWILGQKVMPYPNQLRLLNILPLTMFMQLNEILFLSKLTEDDSFLPMLKQNSEKGRTNELFKLPKTRTEKARTDFFFRTCRLANRIEKYIEFNTKKGLEN